MDQSWFYFLLLNNENMFCFIVIFDILLVCLSFAIILFVQ